MVLSKMQEAKPAASSSMWKVYRRKLSVSIAIHLNGSCLADTEPPESKLFKICQFCLFFFFAIHLSCK